MVTRNSAVLVLMLAQSYSKWAGGAVGACLREGPVVERGAGVVVVDEGDGAAGPHAHDARGAALAVHHAPVLAAPHGLLRGRGVRRSGRVGAAASVARGVRHADGGKSGWMRAPVCTAMPALGQDDVERLCA